jgi:hypothetical protein
MSRSRFAVMVPVLFCIPALLAQRAPAFDSIPLIIEKNQGQAPADVRYLSRYGTLQASFRRDEVEFNSTGGVSSPAILKLCGGAAQREPIGSKLLASRSNYFLGSDSSQWVTGVENDAEVVYSAVYPGIDLVFHGTGSSLEHDFRVAAGADPSRIAFRIEGARTAEIDANGNLRIELGSGKLILDKPQSFQESATGRRSIDSEFIVAPDGEVRFRLGTYDHTRELVIDPVLGFSTYFNGSGGSLPLAVATDKDGNVYVAGTASKGLPLKDPVEASPNGGAFVSSLDPTGKTLRFSTFLGSGDFAGISAIAIDSDGNVVVAGIASSKVPHAGALPAFSCSASLGCYFIASLSPSGAELNYAGMAGGGAGNYGDNVLYPTLTLDSKRNAYLTGITDDTAFLITPGTLGKSVPGYPQETAFVMKFSPAGEVVYSTVIPGKTGSNEGDTFAIAGSVVDADGLVTVGGTASTGLPTTAGVVGRQFPASNAAASQPAGFILELNPTASAIHYATYLPGTDEVGGITQDKSGNIWVAGSTAETNLPASAHAFQKTPPDSPAGCEGGFVMEVGDNGKHVLTATYLSGEYPTDSFYYCTGGLSGIALDSKDNVYVGGFTGSPNFPVRNPLVDFFDAQSGYAADMILAGLNPSLGSLIFGSYLNPWGYTQSENPITEAGSTFAALAVDSKGNLIVTGESYADAFPTTKNVFQPKSEEGGFITKIDMSVTAPSVCFNTTNLSFSPGSQPVSLNLTNCGDAMLHVKSVVSSSTLFSVESSCSVLVPGSSCTITVTYTATTPGRDQGTITITDDAPVQPQILEASSTP